VTFTRDTGHSLSDGQRYNLPIAVESRWEDARFSTAFHCFLCLIALSVRLKAKMKDDHIRRRRIILHPLSNRTQPDKV
jgi:hypothetical protein